MVYNAYRAKSQTSPITGERKSYTIETSEIRDVMFPYPHSCLCEVCPHGYLLPRAHVWVAVPLEGGLELLQLLAREVCPLPPLLLLLRVVSVPIIAAVLHVPLLFCKKQREILLPEHILYLHMKTGRQIT